MDEVTGWFKRQWKVSPKTIVMIAVMASLAIVWLIFTMLLQLKWANWLLIPILSIDGILIFKKFKERKYRSAFSAAAAAVYLVAEAVAVANLLDPIYVHAISLLFMLILVWISRMFPKGNDGSADV